MNQQIKTSLGVIIILIVAVTAGVFIWKYEKRPQSLSISQNQTVKPSAIKNQRDKTDNWRTYRNNEYSYKLKYPADWKVIEDVKGFRTFIQSPDCDSYVAEVCTRVSIWDIRKAENNETIESSISLNANDKIIDKKTIKISGEDASFVEYYQTNYGQNGKNGLVRQEIKMIHGGIVYQIRADEVSIDKIKTVMDLKNKNIFETMIQSFEFLKDVDKNNKTADWETYQNYKYSYSIQYPSHFELSEKVSSMSSNNADFGQGGYVSIIGQYNGDLISVDVDLNGLNLVKCQNNLIKKSIVDSRPVEICGDGGNFYVAIPKSNIANNPENLSDYIFISAVGSSEKKQNTQNFFELILSTFKFTN